MKFPRILIMLLPIAIGSCDHATEERIAGPIMEIMNAQEFAWNAGDIDRFMEGYSDTICFIGSNGRTCGRDAVTANYMRSYPDKGAMGRLKFDVIEIVPAGESNAWVTGGWRLFRSADTLEGGFSLLWALEREGWRIVRDHSY